MSYKIVVVPRDKIKPLCILGYHVIPDKMYRIEKTIFFGLLSIAVKIKSCSLLERRNNAYSSIKDAQEHLNELFYE